MLVTARTFLTEATCVGLVSLDLPQRMLKRSVLQMDVHLLINGCKFGVDRLTQMSGRLMRYSRHLLGGVCACSTAFFVTSAYSMSCLRGNAAEMVHLYGRRRYGCY